MISTSKTAMRTTDVVNDMGAPWAGNVVRQGDQPGLGAARRCPESSLWRLPRGAADTLDRCRANTRCWRRLRTGRGSRARDGRRRPRARLRGRGRGPEGEDPLQPHVDGLPRGAADRRRHRARCARGAGGRGCRARARVRPAVDAGQDVRRREVHPRLRLEPLTLDDLAAVVDRHGCASDVAGARTEIDHRSVLLPQECVHQVFVTPYPVIWPLCRLRRPGSA